WRSPRPRGCRAGAWAMCRRVRRRCSWPGDGMNEQQSERALVVAGGRLQGLVLDLAREIHGDAAVERRARYDGDQFPELVATPLVGLWAADGLLKRVGQEVQRH